MLRMLINRCGQALLGHCGLKPGEVVGLLLPNIPEYIIVCHGAMEAGLTVTFVNPLYTPGNFHLKRLIFKCNTNKLHFYRRNQATI